jgi:hypothetical protein
VTQTVFGHLRGEKLRHHGIETAMRRNQLQPLRPAVLEKAVLRVPLKTIHRRGAVNPAHQGGAERRDAVGKCQHVFTNRHVIEREPLDQGCGPVFLREPQLSDRDIIADQPWGEHQSGADDEGQAVSWPGNPPGRCPEEATDQDEESEEWDQHQERWPPQAQQARENSGDDNREAAARLCTKHDRQGRQAIERERKAFRHQERKQLGFGY